MYDQKPTTSLMEDLQVLGLIKQPKGGRSLAETQDFDQDDPNGMDPDPAAMGPGPDQGMGAPDPTGAPAPQKPKMPPFPSQGAPAPAPAPAPEAEEEKDEFGQSYSSYDMAPGEEMAAYESAWNCVKQYYALNERNEQLSEDDYKTVVNAMSFIIETQGKYLKQEPDHDPDELPGGNNPSWAGSAENNPNEKVDGTGAMRKPSGWRYHDASPRPSEKAESLSALVGELKSLTQQTESNDEMQDLGNKIIEGFEAIRDTASEVAHGIASQLRESNEKVKADNPKVRLGKYFEGVAGDATLLLKAISERETTDVDDAIEDLNSLSRDLKRGLAQL